MIVRTMTTFLLRKLKLGSFFITNVMFSFTLLLVWFPTTGSRSFGNFGESFTSESVKTKDTSSPFYELDERHNYSPTRFTTLTYKGVSSSSGRPQEVKVLNDGESDTFSLPINNNNNEDMSVTTTTHRHSPCNLVEATSNLKSYQDTTLLSVSHNLFDVSDGVVPGIMYTVALEVPADSTFSLDYWIKGSPIIEDATTTTRTRRRHQREKDSYQLILKKANNSESDPDDVPAASVLGSVRFCSKSSLDGENKYKSQSVKITFTLIITTSPKESHYLSTTTNAQADQPHTLSSSSSSSRIVFRLRFSSLSKRDSTTIFEQTLNLQIKPDCSLTMRILKGRNLNVNSLWTSESGPNQGINCTITLLSQPRQYGLEVRIANLSIHGMRDICKGRYLTFSRTMRRRGGGGESEKYYYGSQNNPPSFDAPDLQSEFPTFSNELSPLDRKFCGKLQDYSVEERRLTFRYHKDEGGAGLNPNFFMHRLLKGEVGQGIATTTTQDISESKEEVNFNKDEKQMTTEEEDALLLLLRVSLPFSLRPRETFSLDLSTLSPCAEVVLTLPEGSFRHSLNNGDALEEDECSIIIHVPFGYRILTRIILSSSSDISQDFDEDNDNEGGGGDGESVVGDDDDSYNSTQLNGNFNVGGDINNGESEANKGESRTQSPYDCPSDSMSGSRYMIINAEDIDGGLEFTWCFLSEESSEGVNPNTQMRAWKSSGNKVKLNFQLKYFQTFQLTYQSVKVEEISGDCDEGWVLLGEDHHSRCITLVEERRSWPAAEESCQMKGGHLLSLLNDNDEFTVQQVVTQSAFFHPSRGYWIGANDRESEGNFQWTSGLPFSFTNWFQGWTNKRSEISNAQPNDDGGWRGQDCVEIRQVHDPSIPLSPQPLSSQFLSQRRSVTTTIAATQRDYFSSSSANRQRNIKNSNGANSQNNFWPTSRFYWNDRGCNVKNAFICEKTSQKIEYKTKDPACNKTVHVSSNQEEVVTLTSPGFPSTYPDNIICNTLIETVPGYRIVLAFDHFVLEESPSCQYDALQMTEILHNDKNEEEDDLSTKQSQVGTKGSGNVGNGTALRLCGDWSKRLKLLRYKTVSSTSSLLLRFESDFSHHFSGFKVKVWTEKDIYGQCSHQQMQKYGQHCYLVVNFPAVTWNTAQQICTSLKGKLASVLSGEEWKFLTRSISTSSRYERRSSLWIGGSIDRNSQLVWSDRSPFNFSVFHPSDLQTISDWRCLRIYWHEGGGKGDFAWKLADCSQLAGYVCKKRTYDQEPRQSVNKTFSGTGGKQSSPNFPSNYPNNVDYAYHLVAPRGTQIVLRFSHIDIEDQENCLYDYVEIIDRKRAGKQQANNNTAEGGSHTRYCGSYTTPEEVERLDFVSSSNEIDLHFHSDFSNTKPGFQIVWRAVDVTSCLSGKTILAGSSSSGFGESGFSHSLLPTDSSPMMIHSPNFPHFNLQNLNCVYTIVAPAGHRIWLSFTIFEMGHKSRNNKEDCHMQDHALVDLTGGAADHETGNKNKAEIILCGNMTSSIFRTSFVSSREKIQIRLFSPIGKSGRGFLGQFKAISDTTRLTETLNVAVNSNSSISLTSLNFPLSPPANVDVTFVLFSPPNYVLSFTMNGTTSTCPPQSKSYLEIRDPYHGTNGTTWRLCQTESGEEVQDEEDEEEEEEEFQVGNRRTGLGLNLLVNNNENRDDNNKVGGRSNNEISPGSTQMMMVDPTSSSFRSTFNRLDIRQVYGEGFHGRKWNARVVTSLDENFRAKVLADGDRLLKLDGGCVNSPCANGGSCVTENGKHICRCPIPFTGPFCGLSLCDLNPCLFGDCVLGEKSIKCTCQLGYGGEMCDRRMKPCDDNPNPCSGHGNCIEVNKTGYKCMCHAWWEGPQCESRMQYIPFKPLSQRVLEEPFWLGLITVTVVLGVIGLIWCLKRHFPEKLEKLLNEDVDRNRGISWVSTTTGRSPSFRAGQGPSASTCYSVGIRDPIPGTSSQILQPAAISPPMARSFLGRLGIRKASLLSLSSATSNISVAPPSPHSNYDNRTFSLDDLLRPSRSMTRTPSPHRRRNYSVQVRRDPAEKQLILQQLVSSGKSSSLDGETGRPLTPKPTLAEIIQMSERRLRLASAAQSSNNEPGCSSMSLLDPLLPHNDKVGEEETSFIIPASTSSMSSATTKAEKKVTFAQMLDKMTNPTSSTSNNLSTTNCLGNPSMTSSSSCSDVSCAEDVKMVATVIHHAVPLSAKPMKKEKKGRFRRSKGSYHHHHSHRGRGNSETDQDYMDVSSSDTTPDPIYTPKLPSRLCISPTGPPGNKSTTGKSSSQKIKKIPSADSLLALFRRFSGSNSAPPSPQYSENEESSTGATPLSTPSSPRNSLMSLSIRPPALMITSVPLEPASSFNTSNTNSSSEQPMIDQLGGSSGGPGGSGGGSGSHHQSQMWSHPSASNCITLEVPMRDYCLSPIHEVPTPLATPSHSPCHTPMMRRAPVEDLPAIKILFSSEEDDTTTTRSSSTSSSINRKKRGSPPKPLQIPEISITIGDDDECDDGGNNNDDDNDELQKEEDGVPEGEEESVKHEKHFHRNHHHRQHQLGSDGVGDSEVIPDVLIHVPPDACVESQPESDPDLKGKTSSSRPNIGKSAFFSDLPCDNLFSYKDGDKDGDGNKTIVPVVSIEYATPVLEHLPKFPSTFTESLLGKKSSLPEIIQIPMMVVTEHDSTGSPPLAPPMITINQSSEAESDSDTAAHSQRHHIMISGHRLLSPNLCFLSPFAHSSDRVPSESNLSTSGYSSMASPCHSRCPSVSPLCSADGDDFNAMQQCTQMERRASASLTPGTPKKVPPTPRRSSFNASHLTSGLVYDNSDKLADEASTSSFSRSKTEVEIETDSAVEVEIEMDTDAETSASSSRPFLLDLASSPKTINPNNPREIVFGAKQDIPEPDLRVDPSKPTWIDMKTPSNNSGSGVTIVFPLSPLSPSTSSLVAKKSTNLIEIPEEKERIRLLSPVSSRSESPLSEMGVGGMSGMKGGGGGSFSFLGSPLTDSDGVYDCGSSEVLTAANNDGDSATTANPISFFPNNNSNSSNPSRLIPRKRSFGKKKDRNSKRSLNRLVQFPLTCDMAESPGTMASSSTMETLTATSPIAGQEGIVDPEAAFSKSRLHLPPSLARDFPHSSISPKRISSKRRSKMQAQVDSSSSSESLGSNRSRSSWSSRQNSRNQSRTTSPIPYPSLSPNKEMEPQSLQFKGDESGQLSPLVSEESRLSVVSPSTSRVTVVGQSGGGSSTSKISRLRTISHQIRFLRRLELSLIRKKEGLTHTSKSVLAEDSRRESVAFTTTDSAENSSRCDSDSSSSSSSICSGCSECSCNDDDEEEEEDNTGLKDDDDKETPLLLPKPSSSKVREGSNSSSSSSCSTCRNKPRKKVEKVTPRKLLETISRHDGYEGGKKRGRKYK